ECRRESRYARDRHGVAQTRKKRKASSAREGEGADRGVSAGVSFVVAMSPGADHHIGIDCGKGDRPIFFPAWRIYRMQPYDAETPIGTIRPPVGRPAGS